MMSKKIFKYPIELKDRSIIRMPEGAIILSVDVQYNNICIWALVDPNAEKKEYVLLIVGTGDNVPPEITEMDFLGTVQQFVKKSTCTTMHTVLFVWHLWGKWI